MQIVDLDRDGKNDLVVCDAQQSRVLWYRQVGMNEWQEHVLGEDLPSPAHATVVDFDSDCDLDIVVAVLGAYWPTDEFLGQVVLLQQELGQFVARVLATDLRRVADVQAGDLDDDGDVDLVVGVFGYSHGQILWLENLGEYRFFERELLAAPGTIHVPLADFDGDGDCDIAAVVSQDEEEIWGFQNLGGGSFQPIRIHASSNHDIGSAGLVVTDLDRDGDADLLWPVGDNMEDRYAYPQPFHGCYWFENRGEWNFVRHRIGQLGGTYAAAAGDVDGDGDRDVVLVSMCNDWRRPGAASVVWLENDGSQSFRPWQVDDRPTHLVTVACGDLDGNGLDDIVAGGVHLIAPFDRLGRITAWFSGKGPK